MSLESQVVVRMVGKRFLEVKPKTGLAASAFLSGDIVNEDKKESKVIR